MAAPNFMIGGPIPHRNTRETDKHCESRLKWEKARLDEARAEFECGLDLDEAEVAIWLESLDCDEASPLPKPRRSKTCGL